MDAADALVAKYSWLGRLGGKRFVMTLITAVITLVSAKLGVPSDILYVVMGVAVAYITGQTVTDVVTKGATSDNTPNNVPMSDPVEMARIALAVETEKTNQNRLALAVHKEKGQQAMAENIKEVIGAEEVNRLERFRRAEALAPGGKPDLGDRL